MHDANLLYALPLIEIDMLIYVFEVVTGIFTTETRNPTTNLFNVVIRFLNIKINKK